VKRGLIIVLSLGCVIGLWKAVQEKLQQTPQIHTTEEFIAFGSKCALADAQTYDHNTLDYSIDSLKQVDQILGRVHDAYVKEPSSVSVRGIAAEYGAYVGEVIRRSQPNAYWTRDSEAAGQKSYPLHWKTHESYPITWCAERITDGEEHSIWLNYSVLNDPDWKDHNSADWKQRHPEVVVRSTKVSLPK